MASKHPRHVPRRFCTGGQLSRLHGFAAARRRDRLVSAARDRARRTSPAVRDHRVGAATRTRGSRSSVRACEHIMSRASQRTPSRDRSRRAPPLPASYSLARSVRTAVVVARRLRRRAGSTAPTRPHSTRASSGNRANVVAPDRVVVLGTHARVVAPRRPKRVERIPGARAPDPP